MSILSYKWIHTNCNGLFLSVCKCLLMTSCVAACRKAYLEPVYVKHRVIHTLVMIWLGVSTRGGAIWKWNWNSAVRGDITSNSSEISIACRIFYTTSATKHGVAGCVALDRPMQTSDRLSRIRSIKDWHWPVPDHGKHITWNLLPHVASLNDNSLSTTMMSWPGRRTHLYGFVCGAQCMAANVNRDTEA